MCPTPTDNEVNIKIINALDKAIKEGPWEKSPFLKATGKKLESIREKFKEDIGLGVIESVEETTQISDLAVQDAKTLEVYISLYVSGGGILKNWEGVLHSIYGFSITRPIYRNEEDIQKTLRAKGNHENDAYAAVIIKEDSIRPVIDEAPKDRFGNELLQVKEGSISPENVKRFMHLKAEYEYRDGVLKKV